MFIVVMLEAELQQCLAIYIKNKEIVNNEQTRITEPSFDNNQRSKV